MKPHSRKALDTFNDGCDRALGLSSIYRYLDAAAPPAMNCDDLLRSSVVLLVSSFDLLMHEIYRGEVIHRLVSKRPSSSLRIPFDAGFISGGDQVSLVDRHIRAENSYKSFVAPKRVAECLQPFLDNAWVRIAEEMDETAASSKLQLKSVVDLRNRIAHEGDVKPEYNGIELWSIYLEDVESSICFVRRLGASITSVVDGS